MGLIEKKRSDLSHAALMACVDRRNGRKGWISSLNAKVKSGELFSRKLRLLGLREYSFSVILSSTLAMVQSL